MEQQKARQEVTDRQPGGNMALWDKVCETDPSYTRVVEYGKRKYTTIDAMYQVMRATELWGPVGYKWGVRNERKVTFHVDANLVLYEGVMWYPHNEEECEVPIESSWNIMKDGKADPDCVKKVSTDALKKGLSKIGFSADVFLGMFDDDKYVDAIRKKYIGDKQKASVVPIKEKDPEEVLSNWLDKIKISDDDIKETFSLIGGIDSLKDIKEEDRKLFCLVAKSFSDIPDEKYFIDAISGELRKALNEYDPELFKKIMNNYGFDLPDKIFEKEVPELIIKPLEGMSRASLADIYRTIRIGLAKVGVKPGKENDR